MAENSDFVSQHLGGGYSSELESTRSERKVANAFDTSKPVTRLSFPASSVGTGKLHLETRFETIRTRELNKLYGGEWRHMVCLCHFQIYACSFIGRMRVPVVQDAWSRHQKLVSDYLSYYGGKMSDFAPKPGPQVTDYDILRSEHR